MKFLGTLIGIVFISGFVYVITSKLFFVSKKSKKFNRKPLFISAIVLVSLLSLFALVLYRSATAPDMWCSKTHIPSTPPPTVLKSAIDYFEQGNYEYDTGNCSKAIISYTKSIALDPKNPQVYNNRAYTFMRLRDYQSALSDLDKALRLKPDYIQALMNRADIHNYYYQIDRASAVNDYKKAISLGASQKETSVCGHLFLAKHNGWTLGAYLDIFSGGFQNCN